MFERHRCFRRHGRRRLPRLAYIGWTQRSNGERGLFRCCCCRIFLFSFVALSHRLWRTKDIIRMLHELQAWNGHRFFPEVSETETEENKVIEEIIPETE